MNTTPGGAGVGPNPLEVAAVKAANSATSEETPATPTPPTTTPSRKIGTPPGFTALGSLSSTWDFPVMIPSPLPPASESEGTNFLAGNIVGGKCAPSIGVFNSVQVRGWSVGHTRRKVNAADESNSARRERCLIVAEISGCARECHGQIVHIDRRAEISDIRLQRRWLAKDGKDFSAAIDDCDNHGVESAASAAALTMLWTSTALSSGNGWLAEVWGLGWESRHHSQPTERPKQKPGSKRRTIPRASDWRRCSKRGGRLSRLFKSSGPWRVRHVLSHGRRSSRRSIRLE